MQGVQIQRIKFGGGKEQRIICPECANRFYHNVAKKIAHCTRCKAAFQWKVGIKIEGKE
jgi:ribosomal protein L37AE/L43A